MQGKLRVCIMLFVITSGLFAQVNKDYDGVKPEVTKGARSLVFTYIPFQSNLGASPAGVVQVFNGEGFEQTDVGGIGLKYFFTDKLSVLGALGFGTGSSSRETENDSEYETTTAIIVVSVDADYHLPALYNISPYVGCNLNIGTYSFDFEYKYSSSTLKQEASSSSFGLGVNLGFDWYFSEGLSLGGKYTLGLRHLGEPEYNNDGEKTKGASSTEFGTGLGSIVLNIHF